MSEHLHPGVHLDADTISAFVEGLLPEHERAQCLAHLAECGGCREVAFLAAQDDVHAPAGAVPAPVVVSMPRPAPSPARGRWLRPMPLLAAAAAVFAVLLGAWLLYVRSRTGGAPPHELVAQATPPAPIQARETPSETPTPKPTARQTVPSIRTGKRLAPDSATPPVATVPTRTAPPPAIVSTPDSSSNSRVSTGSTDLSIPPAPKPPLVNLQIASGISGTVTDASGAAVPNATVQLRQLAAGASLTTNVRTDPGGQFKFSGLAPGQYELQINAQGFQRKAQRVELQPQEVASVKSELQVGSVASTVEVTAASPTLQTESSMTAGPPPKHRVPSEPRPLPNQLPAERIVRQGKIILAIDSAGALFYSGNSGKSWKAVKTQWSGKVNDLIAPPDMSNPGKAKFQLATDADATWLSRDGRHWYQAPQQH